MSTDAPLTEFARVNPPRPRIDLEDADLVSFIPMSDVTETGRWAVRQARPFGEVRRGYTCFAEGDVLFAKITPCTENGKGCHATGLENGLGFASTEFHVLRARDCADPGFIYQWSIHQPLRLKAASVMTGSAGQQRVPASFFDTFFIPRLTRNEQSKIAEVLSTVDRAMEQTEAIIAKQQRMKTGLMQDLLTRGIDEHGNLRSERTHKFKDSPLGRIPVEWCITTVGEQFAVRTERGRRGLPIMSVVMIDGLVERATVDRRVESTLPDEGHAFVVEGDITYNMMRMWQGVLGRASFDSLVSPAYVVLQPRISIDSRFAEWLFRDARMVHAFHQASKGVVDDRLRLYPQDLFPIALSMPTSRDEQSLIVRHLDAQKALIASETLALEKLRHLRKGLMQDLLTGHRRVTALLEPHEATTR